MKSLSTALKVLLEFTNEQQHQSVSSLTEKTGLTKGQVSKILGTFRQFGILQQDPQTRLYSVGLNAFAIGSRYVNYHPLAREALPLIRRLVDQTGHSARLSVMSARRIIYLLQADGHLLSDTGWRAGMFLPIHATTAGKVALAFVEPAVRDEIVDTMDMPALTPNTITDRDVLRKQLSAIAKIGYGVSRSESKVGLGAVGVPVFAAGMTMLAVLSLSFPDHIVGSDEEADLAGLLHDAARALSQRMGCEAYPFGGKPTVSRPSKVSQGRGANRR
jgi:DNA-binding IclR family transcriptional regulator